MSGLSTYRFNSLVMVFFACLLSGCADRLIYGEKTEFDLAVVGSPPEVGKTSVNIGLNRTVLAVVPPSVVVKEKLGTKAINESANMLSDFQQRAVYTEHPSIPCGQDVANEGILDTLFGVFTQQCTLSINTAFASGKTAQNVSQDEKALKAFMALTGSGEKQ